MPQDLPYPHAPLELVLVEIVHPLAEPLSRASLASLKRLLADETPIQHVEESIELTSELQAASSKSEYVLSSRDRRSQVTFKSNSILVQTTKYSGWTAFRQLIMSVLQARQQVSPLDGVERIGLRFIDEVRVPQAHTEPRWSDWVSEQLTGPAAVFDDIAVNYLRHQGVATFGLGDAEVVINLRYGAASGAVIMSTPTLLRREEPATGPFFLLDTDASWTLSSHDAIPQADTEAILEKCDRLHQPIQQIFESLITDRLRDEVLYGRSV